MRWEYLELDFGQKTWKLELPFDDFYGRTEELNHLGALRWELAAIGSTYTTRGPEPKYIFKREIRE